MIRCLVAGALAAAALVPSAAPARAAVPTAVVALPAHSTVLASAQRAADYYRASIAHPTVQPTNGWSWATYEQGAAALYRQSGQARYLADGLAWGRSHAWSVYSGLDPDSIKAGQTYYDLQAIDPSVDLAPIDARMASDLTQQPASAYDWVDALFMGLPGWTRWAARTGDPRYLDKLDAFYTWTRDRGATSTRCAAHPPTAAGLYDAVHRLWYRDCTYVGVPDANGRPVFWGRGNGWVAAAMAQVLQTLPVADPRRDRYAAMLAGMAAALVPLQAADGLWRASLLDQPLYPDGETSATALISYALAVGVRLGALDAATYQPVLARAWRGLTTVSLQPSGFVSHCQAVGSGPGPSYLAAAPRTPPTATSSGTLNADSPPYCVGAVLLAGSALADLAAVPTRNRPVTATAQQVGNLAPRVDDGDVTTRWSAPGFPQTVTLDLGSARQVGNTMVVPYADRAYRYRVQTSTDRVNWRTAVDRTTNTSTGTRLDDFPAVTARWVRLTVTGVFGAATTWVSISEFGAYSP